MGLESFKGGADSEKEGIKWSKPKLHEEHLCPKCGSSNTEGVAYYRRCNNPDCRVITYLTSS